MSFFNRFWNGQTERDEEELRLLGLQRAQLENQAAAQSALIGGLDPRTGILWNTGRQAPTGQTRTILADGSTQSGMMDEPELLARNAAYSGHRRSLLNLAFPEEALAAERAAAFPQPPTPQQRYSSVDGIGLVDLYADGGPSVAIERPASPQRATWNNPVSEIGPDGRPISVQYSSDGQRRVVEGATPSRQGNPFDRQDYWRQQVRPLTDSATNARVQTNKVRTSLALNTGTGHIAAINALQKQIDEGAVVRDQDVALIQSAQSLLSRLSAQMDQLSTGKLLSPELQQELMDVSTALEGAVYAGVNERITGFSPVMQEEGVNIDSVVPPAIRAYLSQQQTTPGGQQNYGSADEVRSAFLAGRISEDDAKKILIDRFGYEP